MGYSNVALLTNNGLSPSDVASVGLNSDGTITNSSGGRMMVNLLDAPYASYSTFYGFFYIEPGGPYSLSSIFSDTSMGQTAPANLVGCYVHLASTNAVEFPIVAPYSACGAPTSVTLGKTLSSGEQVQLSWSGASAGNSNAITGYEVYRYESSDGASWGSEVRVGSVSTSATSGSLMVDPPSTYGNYYRFAVRTLGAAGASYYSGWTNSGNTLRRNHAPFDAWTDPTLTVGTTKIKAVHMTELQERVNTLRTFYGLSKYSFTTITAGTTSLAGWTSHVNQIRTAIDQVCTASGKTHAAWISFSVNCPRADVIQQMRDIVLAL